MKKIIEIKGNSYDNAAINFANWKIDKSNIYKTIETITITTKRTDFEGYEVVFTIKLK